MIPGRKRCARGTIRNYVSITTSAITGKIRESIYIYIVGAPVRNFYVTPVKVEILIPTNETIRLIIL